MLDDEKDLFIKEKLQQDKMISDKANDVFKNFKKEYLHIDDDNKNTKDAETIDSKADEKIEPEQKQKQKKNGKVVEFKPMNFFIKARNFTAVAASFVVAVSVGTAAAININGNKLKRGQQVESSVSINGGSSASDYIVAEVKNEEVKVDEIRVTKVDENELIKAVLTSDGNVAIQMKEELLKYYKFRLDASKMYKVSGIRGEVSDVFVCSIVSKQNPYVLLLKKDGTVDAIQIFNDGVVQNNYKFNFYDNGKIEGLKNVLSLSEQTEPLVGSDNLFYYVTAYVKDVGNKKINDIEKIDMSELSNNKVWCVSEDGTKKYPVVAEEDKCVQPKGRSGASNNVYYINDGCLYHMDLLSGNTKKLVTGVESIRFDADSGYVIVKLKYENYIHAKDEQYVKLEQYNVTDAKVVDKKEDENFILSLKLDGTMTIELKQGAIQRLGAKDTFKEHYIYNYYASGHAVEAPKSKPSTKKYNPGSIYYTNATAIYLGKVGTNETKCVAYATRKNEVVIIDINKFVKESDNGTFEGEPGNQNFYISQALYPKSVKEMKEISNTIQLKDGKQMECKTIGVVLEDNTMRHYNETSFLQREGITDYKIVYQQKTINQGEKNYRK